MYKFFSPFLLLATVISHPFTLSAQNNRLESTGNVGIGTTTPVVRLSVYGSADDSAAISLQSGSNSRFYIQQGGALLKIGGTTSGVGAINVLNTGKVGVGTNNPITMLDVNGDFSLGVSGNKGGLAYSIGFTRAAGAQLYGTTAAGLTLGGDAATADAVFLPNGYVGIGTSSPEAKLDIAGSVQTSNEFTTYTGVGTGGLIIANATRVPRWIIRGLTPETGTSNGGYDLDIQRRNDDGAGIGTALYIRRSDGNVAIGTTTPGPYKLTVEGTIGARRVKVMQGTWADFVFQPEYKLLTLAEVENYIKVNRHLPDVPSAKDVEKEGLDVGEMNKKLLQKVEELTLYLIEQQKQLKVQQEQITALRDQNKAFLNLMKKGDPSPEQ